MKKIIEYGHGPVTEDIPTLESLQRRIMTLKVEKDLLVENWLEEREQHTMLKLHVEGLENILSSWYSVFGHLSKDADTAGNMIYEEQQKLREEVALLKTKNLGLQRNLNSAIRDLQTRRVAKGD